MRPRPTERKPQTPDEIRALLLKAIDTFEYPITFREVMIYLRDERELFAHDEHQARRVLWTMIDDATLILDVNLNLTHAHTERQRADAYEH